MDLLRISGTGGHAGDVVEDDLHDTVGVVEAMGSSGELGVETTEVTTMRGNVDGPSETTHKLCIELRLLVVLEDDLLVVLALSDVDDSNLHDLSPRRLVELLQTTLEALRVLHHRERCLLVECQEPEMAQEQTAKVERTQWRRWHWLLKGVRVFPSASSLSRKREFSSGSWKEKEKRENRLQVALGDGLDDLRISTLLADEGLLDLLDSLAILLVGRTRLVEWRGVVLREAITIHLSQTISVTEERRGKSVITFKHNKKSEREERREGQTIGEDRRSGQQEDPGQRRQGECQKGVQIERRGWRPSERGRGWAVGGG